MVAGVENSVPVAPLAFPLLNGSSSFSFGSREKLLPSSLSSRRVFVVQSESSPHSEAAFLRAARARRASLGVVAPPSKFSANPPRALCPSKRIRVFLGNKGRGFPAGGCRVAGQAECVNGLRRKLKRPSRFEYTYARTLSHFPSIRIDRTVVETPMEEPRRECRVSHLH